jgi:two-component system OmpR family response regulator
MKSAGAPLDLGADAVFDKSSELDDLFTYCMEQTAQHADPAEGQGQTKGALLQHDISAQTRGTTPGRQR